MADGEGTPKAVRATREIVVNIHGEEFDCLLIPRKRFVSIDYTDCPELDPARKVENNRKLTEVTLNVGVHLEETHGKIGYRLTPKGAAHLLDSLT